MTDEPKPWVAGQQAVINRQRVVVIDKVTRSGRAVVGGVTFERNGRECGAKWNCDRLEHITPKIQDEMESRHRGATAQDALYAAVCLADAWQKEAFNRWRRDVPTAEAIDKLERLAAAINAVLGGVDAS